MTTLYMYDDITVNLIPSGASIIAYYVDGLYKNYTAVKARFPNATLVSIAVFPGDDADALDVEAQDATIADIKGWLDRQLARGVVRPVIYTSANNVDKMMLTMNANGFKRSQYRIWSAHYGAGVHLCGPNTCGLVKSTSADWTQYTDRANSSSLDESELGDAPVFTAAKLPAPVLGDAYPSYKGVDLAWAAVHGATSYDVQLIQTGFEAGRTQVTGTSASFAVHPSTAYTWRVASLPNGEWSAPKAFTTPPAPVDPPHPVNPNPTGGPVGPPIPDPAIVPVPKTLLQQLASALQAVLKYLTI